MANEQGGTKFFVLLSTIFLTFLISSTQSMRNEENSLFDIAHSLLQESVRNKNGGSGIGILSGVIQELMQSDGGKQLGDVLTKSNGGSALDLVASLASIWQTSKFNSGSSSQEGSIDPSILSSMVDIFSSLNKASVEAENNNIDQSQSDASDRKKQKAQTQGEQPVNWEAILSFAGNIISSMSNSNQGKDENDGSTGGLESFLSLLPVLMNSISGQHNSHSSHSIPHHTHSQYFPPFLENLHEYWDHFSKSEFGKTLWENSGLSDLVKAFSDGEGQIETEKIFQSLENNTFRRRWIKSMSSFVAQWLKHLTNPKIQKSYLETAQLVCNSFLKAQGYPKETLLDMNKPAKSVSALTDAVFKRQFNLNVKSEAYVGPAVAYLQELFKIGQKKGFGFTRASNDIESKLSETIDNEVIEPILRVNRAYKFALRKPKCANYVICSVNENPEHSQSGLKPGITKLASLGASWYLSSKIHVSYWELYQAAVEEQSCRKYDNNCSEFYVEDTKATTEYYHNEL